MGAWTGGGGGRGSGGEGSSLGCWGGVGGAGGSGGFWQPANPKMPQRTAMRPAALVSRIRTSKAASRPRAGDSHRRHMRLGKLAAHEPEDGNDDAGDAQNDHRYGRHHRAFFQISGQKSSKKRE